MGEVFVSHAAADTELTGRIVGGIRQAGHSIFFDSDREDGITPGEAWQRTLFRELRICDALVFVNSRAGQASKWCHSELAVAIELGKRIYSIDLDRNFPPHPLLQPLQGIRLITTFDASVARLVICGEVQMNMTRAQWAAYVPGQPYQKTCPGYPYP